MEDPQCSFCPNKVEEPGALIFGPPATVARVSDVPKFHVCMQCFETKIKPLLSFDGIVDALEYMSDVFMADAPFRQIIDEGPCGDEEYTMHGDDLGGFCWHFDQVLKAFNVQRDPMERARTS